MKKIFVLALSLLALASCNDSDDTATSYPTDNPFIGNGSFEGKSMHFYGDLTSTPADGEAFTAEDVHFEFVGGNDLTAVLYMHATQFAAAMPGLEMRLTGLEYTGDGKALSFSASSIVPEANLTGNHGDYKPQQRFMITNFECIINNISCRVNFSCIGYIVNFEGRLRLEK